MPDGGLLFKRRKAPQLVDKLEPSPERLPSTIRVLERATNRVGARRELDHDARIARHRHCAIISAPD